MIYSEKSVNFPGDTIKNNQKMKSIKNFLNKLILMAIIMWFAQSCTTVYVYQIGGPGGRELGNQPSTEWKSDVSNTFLYGAIRDDIRIANCALGDGTRINIEEIKIEKNIWCIGLYIVTLGIWDSSKISWRCAKPSNP